MSLFQHSKSKHVRQIRIARKELEERGSRKVGRYAAGNQFWGFTKPHDRIDNRNKKKKVKKEKMEKKNEGKAHTGDALHLRTQFLEDVVESVPSSLQIFDKEGVVCATMESTPDTPGACFDCQKQNERNAIQCLI